MTAIDETGVVNLSPTSMVATMQNPVRIPTVRIFFNRGLVAMLSTSVSYRVKKNLGKIKESAKVLTCLFLSSYSFGLYQRKRL